MSSTEHLNSEVTTRTMKKRRADMESAYLGPQKVFFPNTHSYSSHVCVEGSRFIRQSVRGLRPPGQASVSMIDMGLND